MLGHTDTKTINQRRPLSANMRQFLAGMVEAGSVHKGDLSQSGSNVMRALLDRGYVTWDIETKLYTPTDDGREAVKEQS